MWTLSEFVYIECISTVQYMGHGYTYSVYTVHGAWVYIQCVYCTWGMGIHTVCIQYMGHGYTYSVYTVHGAWVYIQCVYCRCIQYYRQCMYVLMPALQYICKGIQCVYMYVCTVCTNIQSVHDHIVCMLV